jgi:hypothetical protein
MNPDYNIARMNKGDMPPEEPGIYLRAAKTYQAPNKRVHRTLVYSVWNGTHWGASGLTEVEAWEQSRQGHKSWVQDWPWAPIPRT